MCHHAMLVSPAGTIGRPREEADALQTSIRRKRWRLTERRWLRARQQCALWVWLAGLGWEESRGARPCLTRLRLPGRIENVARDHAPGTAKSPAPSADQDQAHGWRAVAGIPSFAP